MKPAFFKSPEDFRREGRVHRGFRDAQACGRWKGGLEPLA